MLEEDGTIAFSQYFKMINSLELLDISLNTIDEVGYSHLFPSLIPSAKSGNLKHLNVSHGSIISDPKEPINALVNLILSAKNIQSLDISCLENEKKKN